MIVFEQEEWVKKAYNGDHKYEQVFNEFNDENKISVVNEILSGAGFNIVLPEPNVTKKIKNK